MSSYNHWSSQQPATWRAVALAFAFYAVLSVLIWLFVNAVAAIGVAVGGAVQVVYLLVRRLRQGGSGE